MKFSSQTIETISHTQKKRFLLKVVQNANYFYPTDDNNNNEKNYKKNLISKKTSSFF